MVLDVKVRGGAIMLVGSAPDLEEHLGQEAMEASLEASLEATHGSLGTLVSQLIEAYLAQVLLCAQASPPSGSRVLRSSQQSDL